MIVYKIFAEGEGKKAWEEKAQVNTEEEALEYIKKNFDIKEPKIHTTERNGFALKGDILVQKIESFLVH